MTTPTPTQILIERVKSFLDVCDHSPAMCQAYPQCDKCDDWQEAKEALETAVESSKNMKSVLQDWTQNLTMMQQTVLLTAIRGPDGLPKYGCVKMLLRWYRRCVLLSAMDGKVLENPYDNNGGSFTGPSIDTESEIWELPMNNLVSQYLRELDAIPHHFQMHFMHSAEILGYKHPNTRIRAWWKNVYSRLVNDMHLSPELEEDMDGRLGDNREQWLKRADPATVN